MSTLIKLITSSRSGGYLNIPAEGKHLAMPTTDNMGILLPAAPEAEILLGADKGTLTAEVKANQVVRIRPIVPVRPTRYTFVQGFNPLLAEAGSVSQSTIVQPNGEFYLVLKAYRSFRPDELEWTFVIYALS
jgi:hypothetical protein